MCAEVWIEYPLKYFSVTEVNVLLGNIVKNLLPDRAYEAHYPQVSCDISRFNLIYIF